MFLSNEELQEMTGYKQHAAQIQWLATNGYNFDVRSDGRPNILIDQVRERQLKAVAKRKRIGPNLSMFDEDGNIKR